MRHGFLPQKWDTPFLCLICLIWPRPRWVSGSSVSTLNKPLYWLKVSGTRPRNTANKWNAVWCRAWIAKWGREKAAGFSRVGNYSKPWVLRERVKTSDNLVPGSKRLKRSTVPSGSSRRVHHLEIDHPFARRASIYRRARALRTVHSIPPACSPR